MGIRGEGLRNTLLVSEKQWMEQHFMLQRLLDRSGMDRSHFYFADLGTPRLWAEVKERNIKTVVGLGERVLRTLLQETDILRWRGRVVEMNGVHFVPTFAPKDLLPQNTETEDWIRRKRMGEVPLQNPPRFQGTWMLDVNHAVHIAKNGFTRRKPAYVVDPTPEVFRQWAMRYFAQLAAEPLTFLSWDIETVYKAKKRNEDELEESELDLAEGTLLRVSFAYEEFTGISVPWAGPYLEIIRELLASAGPKVVWNGITFDVPVVEAADFAVGGEVFDGMDAWKVYQSDLPKGLEFVSSYTSDLLPWKHLNTAEPGLYSAIDADAALRNFLWTRTKLMAQSQWELYYNLYHRVMVPLTRAKKRGNYIDIEARDALKAEMEQVMAAKVAAIQPFVPMDVLPRRPEPYKRQPDERLNVEDLGIQALDDRRFQQKTVPGKSKFCTICGARDVTQGEHFKSIVGAPKLDKEGNQRVGKKGPMFESVKSPCKEAGGVIEERPADVVVWDEILPFNPNSAEQLKNYAKHFGHPVGTDARDSTKEAFDKAHIKELLTLLTAKKDEAHQTFYKEVLDIKQLSKTLGTYIYNPDAEGLIHQTYKNNPSTPRLSGAAYNLMNVGKREDNPWAIKARRQIVARPGHRFVQADSSAIEAVLQGWWMGDAKYMELATQSVHAWVVAIENGIEWTGTVEQVDWLKANYKDEYNKMKTANYLTNFGGGPFLMWKTDRKSFPTKEAAEQTQNKLFARLPKLPEFHHWVRTSAQRQSFLVIPGWNFRHYYYDVFTRDEKGKIKLGKDAKKVAALYPQGCAALFLRENTLLFAYGDEAAEWIGVEPLGLSRGWIDYMPANYAVHDGYTLEVLDGMEDDAVADMEKVLTRPIKHLSGVRVGCEIDVSPVGGNWSPWHATKNPDGLKTIKTVRVPVIPPPNFERLAA
jgi:hypothetical protein